MKPSVTAPGSFAMAAAVALSLTPSPLTMMAMRGASGFPGSAFAGWAKASAGRTPSAAILGMAPLADISRNFWSSGPASGAAATSLAGAGMATSLRSPVLPSMMVTVLVAAGGAAGLSRRSLNCGGRVRVDGDDFWRCLPVGRLCRRAGMQVDRHDDDRLAAERIVLDYRPDHEHAEEQRQHGGHDLRRRDR